MQVNELHNQPVEADTYEASMALNQLLKIGKHAIKIHNMIDDSAEMEAWVAKKIDLAGDYVKKVHGYMQGEKAGLYDDGGLTEDAGEGHMSKSTLYHTAKYAIELMDMINKGDDLEGWVQSKLNKAADYLQGVHNYEEYQKLNPYREELDSDLLQRHAGIIQKNIDEILARETSLDDVDTKPGMMRILAKRVNEVEKEIAKEQRKDTDEHLKDDKMSDLAISELGDELGKINDEITFLQIPQQDKQSMLDALGEVRGILDKHMPQTKDESNTNTENVHENTYHGDVYLEEGIKDWAKRLAMAGVIVGGLAGVGSINDAINNSVPAVKAMNTALEMAQKAGNEDLVKMIEKDLDDAKLRLDIGRDLNYVKDLQDKYAKFMTTEGLNFESKLAVRLEQRIK